MRILLNKWNSSQSVCVCGLYILKVDRQTDRRLHASKQATLYEVHFNWIHQKTQPILVHVESRLLGRKESTSWIESQIRLGRHDFLFSFFFIAFRREKPARGINGIIAALDWIYINKQILIFIYLLCKK